MKVFVTVDAKAFYNNQHITLEVWIKKFKGIVYNLYYLQLYSKGWIKEFINLEHDSQNPYTQQEVFLIKHILDRFEHNKEPIVIQYEDPNHEFIHGPNGNRLIFVNCENLTMEAVTSAIKFYLQKFFLIKDNDIDIEFIQEEELPLLTRIIHWFRNLHNKETK